MRRFFLKLTVFLLPLLLLTALAEQRLERLPNDYQRKKLIAENKVESAETIVLGTSHTCYGINTELFDEPALNLAYPAQDLYYDHQILFKYLPRAKHLKRVVISVSYPSFEAELQNSNASWRSSYYQRFWQISSDSAFPRASDYSSITLLGVETSRNYLLFGIAPPTGEIDDSGNCAGQRLPDPNFALKPNNVIEQHQSAMRSDSIPKNLKYLTEIIEALQARNVAVVIVTTPCFHTYYDNINQEKYVTMQNLLKPLIEKYDLRYFNYFKDRRFDENDFADVDHLNAPGARKLTQILKDDWR